MAVILACAWLIVANVLALIPSKDNHWARAYGLIAVGVPLLIYVVMSNGIWIGLLFLLAACSVLRWPVIYLARWFGKMFPERDKARLGKGPTQE